MPTEVIVAIITGVVSIVAGGGGVFAWMSHKGSLKNEAHSDSVSEWKQLYDEMKVRLDDQAKENEELRDEIFKLKDEILQLRTDLSNYKKYDSHIKDLDSFISMLLGVIKPLIDEIAYKNILDKRPKKIPVINSTDKD